MSGRVMKLLRTFLRRNPTQLDKRVWQNLNADTRGQIRSQVERELHLPKVLRKRCRDARAELDAKLAETTQIVGDE